VEPYSETVDGIHLLSIALPALMLLLLLGDWWLSCRGCMKSSVAQSLESNFCSILSCIVDVLPIVPEARWDQTALNLYGAGPGSSTTWMVCMLDQQNTNKNGSKRPIEGWGVDSKSTNWILSQKMILGICLSLRGRCAGQSACNIGGHEGERRYVRSE